MVKKYFVFIFTFLAFCSLCSVSYAESEGDILTSFNAESEIDELLYSKHEFELFNSTEHLVVTQRTEFWRDMPYSQVDNEIICYMSVNDTLNVGYYYTDVHGNGWFNCRIMNCAAAPHLNGAYGYISANCVKTVV